MRFTLFLIHSQLSIISAIVSPPIPAIITSDIFSPEILSRPSERIKSTLSERLYFFTVFSANSRGLTFMSDAIT